jgi:FLVCR family feline leukemia virus subgroup C receptor-related protein
MLLHFPLSFPANYIVDKYGIKSGVYIAAFFLLLGSWFRCLINTGGGTFWLSIVGAICVGTANPFIINSLNKVSANWFYPSERPGVTSFLSFFSVVTGLFGILIPGIWFSGYICEPGNCSEE